jgi:3',5'-cyclic AMP phosphodiesterase CpdA
MKKTWAFLWITDLHYEQPEANYLDDAKEIKEDYNLPLRDDTFADFQATLNQNFAALGSVDPSGKLSFIAIGGDITTHGNTNGFSRFLKEALPSLQRSVGENKAMCIVPGNHDVTWGLDPTGRNYFHEKFKAFVDMVDQAGASSCLIPKGELHLHSAGGHHGSATGKERQRELEFDWPLHGPIYKGPNNKVLVLNVNSAIRCGELNRKMYADIQKFAQDGYLEGTDAKPLTGTPAPPKHDVVYKLEHIDKGLRKYVLRDVAQITNAQRALLRNILKKERDDLGSAWADYLKVAVVHHHLTTFPGQQTEHKGYEATVDSSQLLDLLTSFNFDIVLTGHKHHPRLLPYRFSDKEIFILGGATVGGHAAGGSFRGFNLVEFQSDDFRRTLSVRDIKSEFFQGCAPRT